jgi:hypothetical protein
MKGARHLIVKKYMAEAGGIPLKRPFQRHRFWLLMPMQQPKRRPAPALKYPREPLALLLQDGNFSELAGNGL